MPVNDAFQQGLDEVIQVLRAARSSGRTDWRVSMEVLDELRRPPTQADPAAPFADTGAAASAPGWEELKRTVLRCEKCPHLVASRTQVVFGVGNPQADLMFIGEAPGADEDRQGEPFVGKAGQLLTKIIETMGLSRGEVFIANVLKCRPDLPEGTSYGNRPPTPEEMETCLPYLRQQIEMIQPKVAVALGATAYQGLFGHRAAITKMRGQWQDYQGLPVMPTYHPSYLLRNAALSVKREVWEDMLQVLERLGLPVTEKQRSYFLPK